MGPFVLFSWLLSQAMLIALSMAVAIQAITGQAAEGFEMRFTLGVLVYAALTAAPLLCLIRALAPHRVGAPEVGPQLRPRDPG